MNPPRIDIRPYASKDCAAVVELFFRSVREVARRDYSEAQVRAWAPDASDPARRDESLRKARSWTAWIGDRLAGFTDLEADGHLDHLYVGPDFQGMGVATALHREAEREARRLGLARLYADVSLTARPAFERFGYVLLAPQTVHLRGQDFLNFRMEKPLTLS